VKDRESGLTGPSHFLAINNLKEKLIIELVEKFMRKQWQIITNSQG
jgi:hypothetical protein